MKTPAKLFWAMLIGFMITSAGLYAGYRLYMPEATTIEESVEEIRPDEVLTLAKEVVDENTTIYYKTVFLSDGITEMIEAVPAKYMLGYDEKQLAESFPEWEVECFSQKEVILRQSLNQRSSQHYVLKDYNGYIAVFQEDLSGELQLCEVTNTPVAALGEEEKKEMLEGLIITGKENLYSVLEDLET